jgi:plasmid stability protein
MPSISVRKIDEETLGRLRIQAAKHGVSMEEEVRQIIKRSVSTPEQLGDLAVKLFGPAYNEEELHIPERETHQPVNF